MQGWLLHSRFPQVFNPVVCMQHFRTSSVLMIISGGQTGADRAALDAARALGLPHGGWLPKGRKTETGPLPARYNLQEMPSYRYRDRTEKNVLVADATLICSFGPLSGGSALTEAFAIRHDRPFLHINFDYTNQQQAVRLVSQWLESLSCSILNVAGQRASTEPRIYPAVFALLTSIRW